MDELEIYETSPNLIEEKKEYEHQENSIDINLENKLFNFMKQKEKQTNSQNELELYLKMNIINANENIFEYWKKSKETFNNLRQTHKMNLNYI